MANNTGGTDIFVSLLTVLFVGLKLTKHIDWSWWWVFSPIWIPICLIACGVGIYFAYKYVT